MGDPFLNYFPLFLLLFVAVVLFYGIIAIHDIPYKIAESRDHPHQDAIHAAGWVSLFTLHALWPFLWIWAMAYRPERGWGFSSHARPSDAVTAISASELEDLKRRIAQLESAGNKARHRKGSGEKVVVDGDKDLKEGSSPDSAGTR
jgi:Protein of unknown function (DUF3302)